MEEEPHLVVDDRFQVPPFLGDFTGAAVLWEKNREKPSPVFVRLAFSECNVILCVDLVVYSCGPDDNYVAAPMDIPDHLIEEATQLLSAVEPDSTLAPLADWIMEHWSEIAATRDERIA